MILYAVGKLSEFVELYLDVSVKLDYNYQINIKNNLEADGDTKRCVDSVAGCCIQKLLQAAAQDNDSHTVLKMINMAKIDSSEL